MTNIKERLAHLLRKNNVSMRSASLASGCKQDFIRNIMRAPNHRSHNHNDLQKVADYFKVSFFWLLTGAGEVADSEKTKVFVKGSVQAGVFSDSIEWPQDQWYEIDISSEKRYLAASRFAAQVQGESMNERYPHGSIVVCVALESSGLDVISGKRYIVHRTNKFGEIEQTVKLIKIDDSGSIWLHPESTHPDFQQPTRLDDVDSDIEGVHIFALVIASYRPE